MNERNGKGRKANERKREKRKGNIRGKEGKKEMKGKNKK
jgi:hypothetical protein